jgi:hypothetical protein
MNLKVVKLNKEQKDRLYVVSALSMLLFLFSLYVYFVSASVLHVVMQQEMQQNITSLHTEIGTLEAQYIAAQHAVSADIATRHGYVAATEKIFIDRSESTLVLAEETSN